MSLYTIFERNRLLPPAAYLKENNKQKQQEQHQQQQLRQPAIGIKLLRLDEILHRQNG